MIWHAKWWFGRAKWHNGSSQVDPAYERNKSWRRTEWTGLLSWRYNFSTKLSVFFFFSVGWGSLTGLRQDICHLSSPVSSTNFMMLPVYAVAPSLDDRMNKLLLLKGSILGISPLSLFRWLHFFLLSGFCAGNFLFSLRRSELSLLMDLDGMVGPPMHILRYYRRPEFLLRN